MKPLRDWMTSTAGFLVLISAFGCGQAPDYRDQRLAEFAQKSVNEQVQQNARMSDVLKRDAEYRRELIAAQQSMTKQLNEQQAAIDSNRDRLETDRRELAQQRHRDPIIAAVIQNGCIMMACLLPLFVALLGIWQMHRQEPEHAAVAELLVAELTNPKLLQWPTLTVGRLGSSKASLPEPPNDSDDQSEPPF